MHIVKLWIQGFRSFAQRQEILFNKPGTVTAVTGWNAATNSGSGTGKSSIFGALATLLGHPEFPVTKQQTYLANVPMDIEGLFEHEGRFITIRRGKACYVVLDGKQVANGVTAVDTWIREFFRISDLDLLSTMTYRPQRCQGLFLSLTDGKKKEFISEVLGLQKYENMADAAGKEANALQQKAVGLETALNSIPWIESPEPPALPPEPEIPVYTDDLTPTYSLFLGLDGGSLEARVKTGLECINQTFDGHINDCGLRAQDMVTARDDVGEKLKILKAEIANRRAGCDKRIAEVSAEAKARVLADAEEQVRAARAAFAVTDKEAAATAEEGLQAAKRCSTLIKEQQAAAQNVVRMQTQLGALQKAVAASTAKLEVLRQQKCNECGQPLHDDALLNAETERYNKLIEDARALIESMDVETAHAEQLKLDVEDAIKAKAEAEERTAASSSKVVKAKLELQNRERLVANDIKTAVAIVEADERKKLEAELAELQQVGDVLQQTFNEAQSKLQEVHAERAAVVERKRAAVDRLQAWARGVERTHAEHKWACERLNAEYSAAVKHALETNSRRSKILLDVAAARSEAFSYSDLQVTAKAFLGAIGEEVLAETSEETNTALAELPNTRGYSLSFVGEHLTQKGTLKQEIKAVVRNAFVEGIDLKSQLSGGQLTSAELAVDLAWAVVLRRRRGGSVPTPAWFVLDEAFDGHDAKVKEACIEILHRIAAQAQLQILVVDHTSEFKASIENRIHVVYTEIGSQVA